MTSSEANRPGAALKLIQAPQLESQPNAKIPNQQPLYCVPIHKPTPFSAHL
jgi:hypothetical protein